MVLDHLHHLGTLAALAGQGGAGLGGVGADFLVEGLGHVVEQAGATGQGDVHVELFGHHAGQEPDLLAVDEQVLPVAGPEAQLAQVLQERLGHVVDAEVEGRL